MAQAKFALSTDDREKELKAISACHEILRDLDTNARNRVVNWLNYWTAAESHTSDGSF
jgi:hypothetical protein